MDDDTRRTAETAPDEHFDTPMAIVEAEEYSHEQRLDMLQLWLSRLAEGEAAHGDRTEVEGALLALQSRAKLKLDEPEEAPEVHNYGVVERTDFRRYGVRGMIERFRGMFRR